MLLKAFIIIALIALVAVPLAACQLEQDAQERVEPIITESAFFEIEGVYTVILQIPESLKDKVYGIEILFDLQKPRWDDGEVLQLPEGCTFEETDSGVTLISQGDEPVFTPLVFQIRGEPNAESLRIDITDEERKNLGYITPTLEEEWECFSGCFDVILDMRMTPDTSQITIRVDYVGQIPNDACLPCEWSLWVNDEQVKKENIFTTDEFQGSWDPGEWYTTEADGFGLYEVKSGYDCMYLWASVYAEDVKSFTIPQPQPPDWEEEWEDIYSGDSFFDITYQIEFEGCSPPVEGNGLPCFSEVDHVTQHEFDFDNDYCDVYDYWEFWVNDDCVPCTASLWVNKLEGPGPKIKVFESELLSEGYYKLSVSFPADCEEAYKLEGTLGSFESVFPVAPKFIFTRQSEPPVEEVGLSGLLDAFNFECTEDGTEDEGECFFDVYFEVWGDHSFGEVKVKVNGGIVYESGPLSTTVHRGYIEDIPFERGVEEIPIEIVEMDLEGRETTVLVDKITVDTSDTSAPPPPPPPPPSPPSPPPSPPPVPVP